MMGGRATGPPYPPDARHAPGNPGRSSEYALLVIDDRELTIRAAAASGDALGSERYYERVDMEGMP